VRAPPPVRVSADARGSSVAAHVVALTDIFNAQPSTFGPNPKATLGLTAGIVVITQIIMFIAAADPLLPRAG